MSKSARRKKVSADFRLAPARLLLLFSLIITITSEPIPCTEGEQSEYIANMTEEEARPLREENARLKAEMQAGFEQKDHRIAELEGLLMAALLRIEELERRLGKDSHTSHKPPSSDGLGRRPRQKRKKSEKRSGGQPGHPGHHLVQVARPDRVIKHRPQQCSTCQQDLQELAGEVKERRQVHDLPEWRLEVEEHQTVEVRCPRCGRCTRGNFPAEVRAAAQYGPRIQALSVYLSHFQLLSMERVCETLADLCGCQLSEGTLVSWIEQAAKRLVPTQERIKTLLGHSHRLHADETGIRIKGLLHWMHVAATPFLTLYLWHRKRGQEAMRQMEIWPVFEGRAIHDRWASYDQFACQHSLCGAHLIRDCLSIAEQDHQPWGQQMADLLLLLNQTAHQHRAQGAERLPKEVRDALVATYFEILATGFAAEQAQAPRLLAPKNKGGQNRVLPKTSSMRFCCELRTCWRFSMISPCLLPITSPSVIYAW